MVIFPPLDTWKIHTPSVFGKASIFWFSEFTFLSLRLWLRVRTAAVSVSSLADVVIVDTDVGKGVGGIDGKESNGEGFEKIRATWFLSGISAVFDAGAVVLKFNKEIEADLQAIEPDKGKAEAGNVGSRDNWSAFSGLAGGVKKVGDIEAEFFDKVRVPEEISEVSISGDCFDPGLESFEPFEPFKSDIFNEAIDGTEDTEDIEAIEGEPWAEAWAFFATDLEVSFLGVSEDFRRTGT
jgi:hypothetical protein